MLRASLTVLGRGAPEASAGPSRGASTGSLGGGCDAANGSITSGWGASSGSVARTAVIAGSPISSSVTGVEVRVNGRMCPHRDIGEVLTRVVAPPGGPSGTSRSGGWNQ